MGCRRLRRLVAPFVVAPPSGARIRSRLRVDDADAAVLAAVGEHLGGLAGADLRWRCSLGNSTGAGQQRTDRKRVLTAVSSSRWAGAITRISNDCYQRAARNVVDERNGLRRAVAAIRRRLVAPVGGRAGRVRGYATGQERWVKQQRLAHLDARLAGCERRLAAGRVSVVRGGRRLLKVRHHLDDAGLCEEEWRWRWRTGRWLICADGEADKAWGNETIRVHPEQGWCELKLPAQLAHLANAPHGRWRLSCPVGFAYRGDEWAAQAASGAVRDDIRFDADRGRWYLDASWTTTTTAVTLDDLAEARVVGVDLNADHLAAWVLDPSGNPIGRPHSIALDLNGQRASTRDGRLRKAITEVLDIAVEAGCGAVAIEDLGFADARHTSRETMGRGRRGRRFRHTVSGIPTARFRTRLAGMAANRGLAVVAVDPAYTSRWGTQHWQQPLDLQTSPTVTVTGHHAAAVVIGRRSHGQRGRRRPGVPRPPHQRMGPGELPARPTMTPVAVRNPEPRQAARPTTHSRRNTCPADRAPPGNQATQHRSEPPITTSARADQH